MDGWIVLGNFLLYVLSFWLFGRRVMKRKPLGPSSPEDLARPFTFNGPYA